MTIWTDITTRRADQEENIKEVNLENSLRWRMDISIQRQQQEKKKKKGIIFGRIDNK